MVEEEEEDTTLVAVHTTTTGMGLLSMEDVITEDRVEEPTFHPHSRHSQTVLMRST